MNLSGIQNIIFDLGGVVLNIDYELTSKAFYTLGISYEQIQYSQQEQSGLFDNIETGKISPQEFRDEIRQYSFLGLSDNEIDAAWNTMILDLPKERLDLLKSLREKHKIFLLSNTNEIHYAAYSANLKKEHDLDGLEHLFEKVYLSHQVGLRKPDPAIFKLVLSENSLEPEKTLFIDDSKQHIDSADALGIKTHWLNEGTMLDLF